ncbi:hypothetical protein TWF694_006962 [Orbilia ellipsospora]|uniref:DUF7702 domain-containing protein n=1 Tax=Orbilia ellipsospora TaxID=2528407 RepID=A0AAV9XLR0_9PEZI
MAHVPFSSIEISSVVFLIIFAILFIPSVFVWISYIRAGYPWRYGFWGATILCASRLACFISELVFYSGNYTDRGAVIAYIVTLSIGFIGLLECESALFVTWAETHIDFNPTQQQIHGKIRLLNIVAMILVIYGSTNTDSSGNTSGTALACIQAGTILFLLLTIIHSLYVAYGWSQWRRTSRTLGVLSLVIACLYVRIIFGVYATFHRSVSMIHFSTANVKYLVGAELVPETIALILMIMLGFINVRSESFKAKRAARNSGEAYQVENLESRKHGQVDGYTRS